MHRNKIRARRNERVHQFRWPLHHEMHMKGPLGMLPQRRHQVGKEQQVGSKVCVRDIEMERIRVTGKPFDVTREIRQIRRPQRNLSHQPAAGFEIPPGHRGYASARFLGPIHRNSSSLSVFKLFVMRSVSTSTSA
jgi:hypothetical protein